jgi:two-component system sensor histidine kinase KdpD
MSPSTESIVGTQAGRAPGRALHPGPTASALEVLLEGDRAEAGVLREVAELLSHELRTPLTTIYSGSKLLNRPGVPLSDATVREVTAAIEAEAERLKRVVEDLVVAARPAEHQAASEPVLLQHVLPAVVAQEQEHSPSLRFVLSVPEHLPAVRGDSGAIEQVLRNLLSNAARFGPPDGVIAVTVSHTPRTVVVRISDQGPGLDTGEADRVFGLFYRSPSSGERAGLGLGLFVCRRLVDAMGGRIWARAGRQGGEFGFELPIESADGG